MRCGDRPDVRIIVDQDDPSAFRATPLVRALDQLAAWREDGSRHMSRFKLFLAAHIEDIGRAVFVIPPRVKGRAIDRFDTPVIRHVRRIGQRFRLRFFAQRAVAAFRAVFQLEFH